MQELGQLLREARLEKGMTLEEVEDLTKIRKRYLQAIEEGQYKVLPGSFYVRAFVKNYAEVVGLDADQVLRMYRNVIPDPGAEASSEVYTQPRRRRNINTEKWSKLASTLVFICFLMVIIGVIYYYQEQNHEPRDRVDDQIPITQELDYSDNASNNPGGNPSAQGGHDPSNTNPLTDPSKQQPEQAPEPVLAKVGTQGGADVYVLKNAEKLYVRMESERADCWYAVKDGGENGTQIDTGTIKAGDAKDYEFAEAGFFHLGYADTVKLIVNGIEFKPSEREGSFKVLIELEEA